MVAGGTVYGKFWFKSYGWHVTITWVSSTYVACEIE